jgi:hypothetical protein
MAISRSSMSKQVARPAKVKKVMGEFKLGTLKSSSGKPVTRKKQAIAIALSEARRPRRPRRPKRTMK